AQAPPRQAETSPASAKPEAPPAAAPVADLEARKKLLLEILLKEQDSRPPRDLPHYALSFAQERLWFIDQLQPGGAAYNIPVAVRLDGPVDVVALASVFSEIVRRHQSLRTTFRLVDGEPVQIIAPAEPVLPPFLDLSALPEPARDRELKRLVAADATRPFDLERGPLF